MTHPTWLHRRRPVRDGRGRSDSFAAAERVPPSLDLRRADLYRLLDEFTRAEAGRQADLIREFEHAWDEFKEAKERAG